MRDNLSLTPNVFIVYPNNRKIVSGEMSFMQRSRRQLLICLACLALTLISVLVLWSTHPLDTEVALVLVTFAIIAGIYMVVELRAALVSRRLDAGQFIDGKIVTSKAFWQSQGRGGSIFSLKITYGFFSPSGMWIEHTDKVQRQDLWKQAPSSYKGFIRRLKHPEEIQELTPEAGTPLTIRYVDDEMFRVM